MFERLSNIFSKPISSSEPTVPSSNPQVDAAMEMIKDCAAILKNEIMEHPNLHSTESFEVIYKNAGKVSEEDITAHFGGFHKNSFIEIRSIEKKDLEGLFNKIEDWNKATGKDKTQLPLLPREIEAVQQIINAIEKEELVIKQGNQFIGNQKSPIFNQILEKAQTIEKASQLGKQMIIGRGEDGIIVAAPKEEGVNLEGIYDILDENVDLKEAFGTDTIYGEEEYRAETEQLQYSKTDAKRADFTEKYQNAQQNFVARFKNFGVAMSNQEEAKKEKENVAAKEMKQDGSGTTKGIESAGEKAVAAEKKENRALLVAAYVKHTVQERLRDIDRTSDEMAQKKREYEEKLEKAKEKKHEIIEEGQRKFDEKKYDIKHENDHK